MQDTHTTHIRARSEMINRRLKRRSSESELFRQAEQEHDSGRMNRPRCSGILFDPELGHRLQALHCEPGPQIEPGPRCRTDSSPFPRPIESTRSHRLSRMIIPPERELLLQVRPKSKRRPLRRRRCRCLASSNERCTSNRSESRVVRSRGSGHSGFPDEDSLRAASCARSPYIHHSQYPFGLQFARPDPQVVEQHVPQCPGRQQTFAANAKHGIKRLAQAVRLQSDRRSQKLIPRAPEQTPRHDR